MATYLLATEGQPIALMNGKLTADAEENTSLPSPPTESDGAVGKAWRSYCGVR